MVLQNLKSLCFGRAVNARHLPHIGTDAGKWLQLSESHKPVAHQPESIRIDGPSWRKDPGPPTRGWFRLARWAFIEPGGWYLIPLQSHQALLTYHWIYRMFAESLPLVKGKERDVAGIRFQQGLADNDRYDFYPLLLHCGFGENLILWLLPSGHLLLCWVGVVTSITSNGFQMVSILYRILDAEFR